MKEVTWRIVNLSLLSFKLSLHIQLPDWFIVNDLTGFNNFQYNVTFIEEFFASYQENQDHFSFHNKSKPKSIENVAIDLYNKLMINAMKSSIKKLKQINLRIRRALSSVEKSIIQKNDSSMLKEISWWNQDKANYIFI